MTTFTLSDLSSVGGAPIADSTTSVTDNDPSSTAQFTTLFSFNGSNGVYPNGGLTGDANGDLFGATFEGGATDYSAVFEIQNTGTVAAPVYSNTPTTLGTFNGSNGAEPVAGLIADANGNLFGTTSAGGANNYGTVFEIKNAGTAAAPVYASAPTTLVNFNGSNGQDPEAGLIVDAKGDLFGTTELGGANGVGTVFEIKNTGTVTAPTYTSTPTTLVSFNGLTDGDYPTAAPILDANGDLFGTTEGGPTGYGTVFEIKNTGTVAARVYSNTPTTLVNFNDSNGQDPHAGLTADANGDLFGTARISLCFRLLKDSTIWPRKYPSQIRISICFPRVRLRHHG